jgi:uncharacterized protein YabE (DUF348 family)
VTHYAGSRAAGTGGRRHGAHSAQRRRRPLLGIAAVVLTVLGIVAGTLIVLTRTVTVSVDGQSRSVTTMRGTVAGVLASAGVTVGAHDRVEPGPQAPVSEGSTVVVSRGRLVTVTMDGRPVELWTTARTVDQALAELGHDPSDFRLSVDRSQEIPLDGLSLRADTLYDVTVNDRGTDRRVSTVAATVAEVLADAGVPLGPNDRVDPALTDTVASDTTVTVTRLPTITLTDGSSPATSLVSDQSTVGSLLAAAGVVLGAQDTVSVPLETPLTDGLQVAVTRVSTAQETETEDAGRPADKADDDATPPRKATGGTQQGRSGKSTVVHDGSPKVKKAGGPNCPGR